MRQALPEFTNVTNFIRYEFAALVCCTLSTMCSSSVQYQTCVTSTLPILYTVNVASSGRYIQSPFKLQHHDCMKTSYKSVFSAPEHDNQS